MAPDYDEAFRPPAAREDLSRTALIFAAIGSRAISVFGGEDPADAIQRRAQERAAMLAEADRAIASITAATSLED